jgi:hypothetical protein
MIEMVQSLRPIAAAVGRTVPTVAQNKLVDLSAHASRRNIGAAAAAARV